MNALLSTFLPLFVAMNVPGILPLFIGLTEGMSAAARQKLLYQAATTAFAIAVLILFAGEVIFKTLGITVNDLRVGGGIILLVLSVTDLVFGDFKRRAPDPEGHAFSDSHEAAAVGVVPLGTPLIVGPAAITTILVSQQSFGYLPTLISLLANLAIVVLAFTYGPALISRLGANTSKAIAKVASLFLAAISIALIRVGVLGMIAAAMATP